MPKHSKPREGSLQFWPRKRAKRIYPSINWMPTTEGDAKPLGFGAWKVGMTHIQLTDTNQKSATYGKIISKPVTVLESPSLFVLAIKYYQKTSSGLKTLSEKWSETIPKDIDISRKTHVSKKKIDEKLKDKTTEIRLLVVSQLTMSGMKKKKPDLFEIGLNGSLDKKLSYAESVLGKEIKIKDVFKQGEYVDVSGVTKGHGFTGSVKRFGIKIQRRKDKQMNRHVGSIGSTTPRKVDWRVPMPGQHGLHTGTEVNKKIILIDDDPTKINVKGGYLRYGNVKGSFILVEGSVPGTSKRFLIIRKASRQKRKELPVDLQYISLDSKQGA